MYLVRCQDVVGHSAFLTPTNPSLPLTIIYTIFTARVSRRSQTIRCFAKITDTRQMQTPAMSQASSVGRERRVHIDESTTTQM